MSDSTSKPARLKPGGVSLLIIAALAAVSACSNSPPSVGQGDPGPADAGAGGPNDDAEVIPPDDAEVDAAQRLDAEVDAAPPDDDEVDAAPPAGGEPEPEMRDDWCDGIDIDRDGTIDEGPDPAIGRQCRTPLPGDCNQGLLGCAEGLLECFSDHKPADEVCDGRDNDCDGLTDIGPDGAPLTEPCPGIDVGVCQPGHRVCADGMFGATCVGAIEPTEESCNQADDDCDGIIDEVAAGCVCRPGETRACGDSPCGPGEQRCADDGSAWLECDQRLPAVETCDGADNDCNGIVDDVAGVGADCSEGQGICMRPGQMVCAADAVVCNAEPGPADPGHAGPHDGLDNDCNGIADDEANECQAVHEVIGCRNGASGYDGDREDQVEECVAATIDRGKSRTFARAWCRRRIDRAAWYAACLDATRHLLPVCAVDYVFVEHDADDGPYWVCPRLPDPAVCPSPHSFIAIDTPLIFVIDRKSLTAPGAFVKLGGSTCFNFNGACLARWPSAPLLVERPKGDLLEAHHLLGSASSCGASTCKDGWAALARFDLDDDGLLAGAELDALALFADRDHDTRARSEELVDLRASGVAAIEVEPRSGGGQHPDHAVRWAGWAAVRFVDGSTAWLTDAYLPVR